MRAVTPFLMFQGEAAPALTLYLTLPGARLLHRQDTPEGRVQLAELDLSGQRVRVTDSPIPHAFTFTPSMSLFLDCDTREEFDRVCDTLGAGGAYLMPPDDYGFSLRFAWLNDPHGVSWQVNLPHAP